MEYWTFAIAIHISLVTNANNRQLQASWPIHMIQSRLYIPAITSNSNLYGVYGPACARAPRYLLSRRNSVTCRRVLGLPLFLIARMIHSYPSLHPLHIEVLKATTKASFLSTDRTSVILKIYTRREGFIDEYNVISPRWCAQNAQ